MSSEPVYRQEILSDGTLLFVFDNSALGSTTIRTWAIRFEGDGLVFAATGALLDGTITGFSLFEGIPSTPADLESPVFEGTHLNTLLPDLPDFLSDWYDTRPEITPEDRKLIQTGLYLQDMKTSYTTYLDQLELSRSEIGMMQTTGASEMSLRGTMRADFFDLRGAEVVLRSSGGDDVVRVAEATGRVFVNLGGGEDEFIGTASESANNAASRVWGGNGNDTLYSGHADDLLVGGTGRDSLFGNLGHDVLKGGLDADILQGGAGNDLIYGGQGRDVLWAGQGDDRMWGGQGADAFLFNLRPAVMEIEPGRNIIRDFDMDEDFLWIVEGYNGNDWGAEDGYDAFMAGATQRDWGVLFRHADFYIAITDVRLDDFTTEHFVEAYLSNGSDFGYASWADLNTDDWTWTG